MRRFGLLSTLLVLLCSLPAGAHAADVHLAWTAPSGDPQGYIMERKTGLAGTYAEVGYPTGLTWTDSNIPASNEVPLCYQVRAFFNELGATEPSNEVCLSLPEVPANIRVVIETFGPSATEPRVSVRTRVRKK